jgi:hypothetical protein
MADRAGRVSPGLVAGLWLRLPDATRVFPAHGARLACGRQLSGETSSTLGEQRGSRMYPICSAGTAPEHALGCGLRRRSGVTGSRAARG